MGHKCLWLGRWKQTIMIVDLPRQSINYEGNGEEGISRGEQKHLRGNEEEGKEQKNKDLEEVYSKIRGCLWFKTIYNFSNE